ncbi:capsular biosynthesis protein CpsI, partial [Prochlorococcus sp. HOT_208_60]
LNGDEVIGIDNLNNYYDISLKKSRINSIQLVSSNQDWKFFQIDLEDYLGLNNIFNQIKPDIVINLAAQAGVRYSLENPSSYIKSNLVGFGNVLELCKEFEVKNLIYASSSSVYGSNRKLPFKETDPVNHPVSLYAATKKSNELMAHTYSHLYNLPCTGLRFFTVYGPWGRPDMAPMIFTKSIMESKPINIFNFGKMSRDFTYIDDICEAIYKCTYKPATIDNKFNSLEPDPSSSTAPYRIFNIGNNKTVDLLYFISLLENNLKKKAIKNLKPIQLGDVENTFSDTSKLQKWINFVPKTSIEIGVKNFIQWYKNFYG